jgi:hypothetical protein
MTIFKPYFSEWLVQKFFGGWGLAFALGLLGLIWWSAQ